MKRNVKILALITIIVLFSALLLSSRVNQLGGRRKEYISLDTSATQEQNVHFPDNSSDSRIIFRGINFYPAPYSYNQDSSYKSLGNLLQIPEINYIDLRFFLTQNNLASTTVSYNKEDDISLARMIGMIHRAGKHVCLEVDFQFREPNHYIANLKPVDIDEWFSSYEKALTHYAVFAQNNRVELFSIGNEMESIFSYSENWERIIAQTRKLYRGKITIKLNCWWQEKSFKDVLKWNWLNQLDYIGISPYFDLTTSKNPTLTELENAWTYSRQNINIVSELAIIAHHFQKKIIFLEIGYRSVNGTNIEPWNNKKISSCVTERYDPEGQILATQALFNVFKNKDWWAGAFWFYWPTAKPASKDTSWAIWGKPVEKVILENYVP